MTAMVTRTLFLAVAVMVMSLAPAAVANDESKALMAFRSGLQGADADHYLTWYADTVDPCSWLRIDCNSDNRVIRITLSNLNVSGRLAPELATLEQLQYIEFARNNLEGPIPTEYGNLTNLVAMDLFDNNLSGLVPSTLGNLRSLVFLRIDHNHFTGPIPGELAALPSLEEVDFSNNDFCGSIPTGGVFQTAPSSRFDNNSRLNSGC